MAISVEQFHLQLEAVRTALAGGDYAGARAALLQAQTVLAGLPDGELAGGQAVTFDRRLQELDSQIARAETRAAQRTGGRISQLVREFPR